MSIPDYLLSIRHIVVLIIPVVVVATLIIQYRSDRDRISDEAESKGCELLSIRRCWLPFSDGAFSWLESHFPGCRLFRVQARERSGKDRTGYVLIGPRRLVSRWDSQESRSEQSYGTLTWRWAERRRSTSE
jgi:hypothetical protein